MHSTQKAPALAVLTVLAGAAFALGGVSRAQTTDCAAAALGKPASLACVMAAIQQAEKNASPASVILSEPVRTYLTKLGGVVGYDDSDNFVAALKTRSVALKGDSQANATAIALLDNAIAASAGEFRAVISPQYLVEHITGTGDLFPQFVEQKLRFFLSPGVDFYDGGPYEVLVRTNLANALEEAFFLNQTTLFGSDEIRRLFAQMNIRAPMDLMRRAYQVVADCLDRINSHHYLPSEEYAYWRNDYIFREVLLDIVIGETGDAKSKLRSLVNNNKDFGLNTPNIDHIYIYKVFPTPYKLYSQKTPSAQGDAVITFNIPDDPDVQKRFYNPAQLALFTCSRLDRSGVAAVPELTSAINGVVLNDYAVIAASTNSRDDVDSFLVALRKILDKHRDVVEAEQQTILDLATGGFSQALRDGAAACNISDEIRDRIFSSFRFVPFIVDTGNSFGRYRYHVVIGSRLNPMQAQTLSDFFNATPSKLPELQQLYNQIDANGPPYVGRMKLNG